MEIVIEQIINQPIDSNCYVVYTGNEPNCIVIDPGTEDCTSLIQFIKSKKLQPQYVILTHEHFDHIWGVNLIKEKFDSKIICSSKCADRIGNRKKNMSVFYDQIGFETYPADAYTDKLNEAFLWNTKELEFINTFGHTDSSISIKIDNKVFVGDLMIKGLKTVSKLPTGNKLEIIKSLESLAVKFKNQDFTVYPGHGPKFSFNDINISDFI